MKRVFIAVLTLSLLLTLAAVPALAGDVKIMFNDKPLRAEVSPVIESGRTLVPLRVIGESLGAEIGWEDATRTITVIKNDKTIKLTLDKKEVYVNDQKVEDLDVPARSVKGRTLVPVRFISETIGANVGWEPKTRTVTITHNETRDGMTPEELFAKSNEAMTKVNTYKFTANGTTRAVANGETIFGEMSMEGAFKAPMETYLKQRIKTANQMINMDITMEMYTKDNKEVYMKMMDEDWQKLEISLPENLTNYQNSQDPTSTLKQIEELGMIFSHGNETVIEGKEHYVLYIRLDEQKFKEMLLEVVDQMDFSLGIEGIEVDEEMMKQELRRTYETMEFGMAYKTYIDKDNFYMTRMDVDGYTSMETNTMGEKVKATTYINMIMNMSDFGSKVDMPTINL